MTKVIKQIPVRGALRTPGGITFNYKPGKRDAADGETAELYVISPAGIEVQDGAANVAIHLYPYDVAVDEAATAALTVEVVDDATETSEAAPEAERVRKVATVDVENPGDISALELPDLKALAKHRETPGRSKMKKADLITALS